MQTLLSTLRQQYDFIIVDLPPLRPVIEGVYISTLLDKVVATIEYASTSRDSLIEMKQLLQSADVKLDGAVLVHTKC